MEHKNTYPSINSSSCGWSSLSRNSSILFDMESILWRATLILECRSLTTARVLSILILWRLFPLDSSCLKVLQRMSYSLLSISLAWNLEEILLTCEELSKFSLLQCQILMSLVNFKINIDNWGNVHRFHKSVC